MSKKDKNLSLYGLITTNTKPFKKEKTKKEKEEFDGIYSLTLAKEHADKLEAYLNLVTNFCIITDLSPKEYKDTVKKWKKLISDLRKGKNLDKIYDKEKYIEYQDMVNR